MNNKKIPNIISEEIKIALSHYPELKDVEIQFELKPFLRKSFMKAQPKISSLFSPKQKRKYVIIISSVFDINGQRLPIQELPKEVIIGWVGHELGHIIDYTNRNSFNLIIFGICYVLSSRYTKRAERTADTYAITHQMGNYILSTKKFILDNGNFPEIYRKRIKRLYLSPDEILQIVKKEESL